MSVGLLKASDSLTFKSKVNHKWYVKCPKFITENGYLVKFKNNIFYIEQEIESNGKVKIVKREIFLTQKEEESLIYVSNGLYLLKK